MSKITVKEAVQVAYTKDQEPDLIIYAAVLEQLHRWGKDAIGNERTPDSYTISFIYDNTGKEKKWMQVEAKWEMNEAEHDNYKKYCAELDAQKNRPLTSKKRA